MFALDGMIFTLQKHGGISVYTRELYNRGIIAGLNYELLLFDEQAILRLGKCTQAIKESHRRLAERYRRCITPLETELFHSSYYRLPQSNKIPSITTVYDFTYEHFSSGIRQWIHSSQKFKAIREATAVICISENTKKDLLELMPNIPSNKVWVTHLAASDLFFPLKDKNNLNYRRPYVLFVGSRVWYKNFMAAVDALTLLSDVELVCVGGGTFTDSERIILERLIPGRYCHEGTVNDERLNYLYNKAICLLYPSSYEGFGLPVLEAMRAGCPVVALKVSSIPEVAGDAAVLLDSAEPELLAKAIEQVADNDFRQGIRQKGFLQAHSFSWDHTFDQTIDVYEEVLGYSLPRTAV